jgi:hypothetical protein
MRKMKDYDTCFIADCEENLWNEDSKRATIERFNDLCLECDKRPKFKNEDLDCECSSNPFYCQKCYPKMLKEVKDEHDKLRCPGCGKQLTKQEVRKIKS